MKRPLLALVVGLLTTMVWGSGSAFAHDPYNPSISCTGASFELRDFADKKGNSVQYIVIDERSQKIYAQGSVSFDGPNTSGSASYNANGQGTVTLSLMFRWDTNGHTSPGYPNWYLRDGSFKQTVNCGSPPPTNPPPTNPPPTNPPPPPPPAPEPAPVCTGLTAVDANSPWPHASITNGATVPVGTNVRLFAATTGKVNKYEWYIDDGAQGNVLQPAVVTNRLDYIVWTDRTFTFTVRVSNSGGVAECRFAVKAVRQAPPPVVQPKCPKGTSVVSKGPGWVVCAAPVKRPVCPRGFKEAKRGKGWVTCVKTVNKTKIVIRVVSKPKPAHTK